MSSGSDKRTVAGTIDAGGVYCSRVAAGGGFVFMTANPVAEDGTLPEAAKAPAPYAGSAVAQVSAQTRYAFNELRDALKAIGSGVDRICQVEQYVKLKDQAEEYFNVALDNEFMGAGRPGGATAQLAGYFPDGAAMSVTGVAIIPDEANGFVKSTPGADPAKANPAAKFSDVVGAGPYAFTTTYAGNAPTGVNPAVAVDQFSWKGSEPLAEAKWYLEALEKKFANTGSSFDDIIDYTLFLQDVGDLYEFDTVFRKAFGNAAPSRTVIPMRGTATPRKEGAFGHGEYSPRAEGQFRFLRPGEGATKVVVDGPGADFGYQSAGVKAGPLLWMSSAYADEALQGKGAEKEAANILEKLDTICKNGGTSIANLLRLRALVTNVNDATGIFAALKKAVPQNPPSVCIAVVQGPLLEAKSSFALDGVAFVEG